MTRPRSALFPHQAEGAAQIAARRRVAVLVPPGYGKTAMVLTALADLGAWPALVAAPLQVARRVWQEEAAAWDHLSGLVVTPVVGPEARRAGALRETSHVDVVNYENLRWLTGRVNLTSRYRAIVFDELSKMKDPGSRRFRRMRRAGAEVPVRVGLTGTPVGNHLLDLWGEVYMVGGAEAVGPRFTDWRDRHFRPVDPYMRVWRPLPGAPEAIREQVRPWCYVLPSAPEVRMPEVRLNPVRLPVPPAAARVAADLRRDLVAVLAGGEEVEALSAAARATKLRQIAGGAAYLDGTGAWAEVHSAKLEALGELLDELQGEPLLVYYWFRHEADRIAVLLRRRGAPWCHLPHDSNAADRWNAREVEVMLAHPQSAGHGLNLQAGGCTACWYTLPWSHDLLTQGCGRLARPGQQSPIVTAHAFLCGEIDDAVLAALRLKSAQESALLGGLA